MIQDEQLISMSWDSQGITKILNEVLRLFKDQQQRISDLESKIETLCPKQDVEDLKNHVNEIESKSNATDDSLKEQIDDNQTLFRRQLDDLKEYVETQNLASLSEARRLVTSELATHVPTLTLSDPVLAKMDQEIKALAKGGGGTGGGSGIIDNSRLENIENMLMSYPKVQGDINTLTMQFPVVIRKLERKINDLIPESATSGQKPTQKSVLDGVQLTSSIDTIPLVDDTNTELEDMKKDMTPHQKIDDLPPLSPIPPTDATTGADSKITPSGSRGSLGSDVNETHTYKTELAPSQRVLGEIEWTKNVIQQHHEAIKQLQQALRTQQDNFDAMTDNFMRANATNNGRISQIAQQQLHTQQESDTIRRQIFDQMNNIQQRLTSINALDSSEPPSSEQNAPRRPACIRSTLSGFVGSKGFDKLPMLRGVTSEARKGRDAFSETDDDDEERLSGRRLSPDVPERAPVKDVPKESNQTKNFTFAMQQFDVSEPIVQGSQAGSKGGEYVRRKTLDLRRVPVSAARLGGVQQKRPQIPALHPLDRAKKEEEEEENDLSPEQDLTPTQPSPTKQEPLLTGSFITIGGRIPQRQMRNQGFEMNQEVMDMIEEKVMVVARKVVTILADNAKDEVQAQANEMKKNVDRVVTMIDGKIDREFVERMFNKFRVMLTELNEKIDNVQCSFLEWVTRDELDLVLQKFLSAIADVKDTAATKTKYNCLLCGRPRNHLAGMMVDAEEETMPARKSLHTAKTRKRNLISRPGDSDRGHSALHRPRDIVQFLTMA